MNKFSYMLLAGLTLAAQVVNPLPNGTTASAQAETNGTQVAQTVYTAAIEGPQAPKTPDFDIEVVAPLKAKQAAEAAATKAKLAAQARAKTQTAVKAVYGGTIDGAFALLRQCEAGGNYATNTGNGYYGAYQYNLGTWANYQGYARPDLAPPAVQDAKARETQARRGWSPWPGCARKLGLM
jgi:hypothetical protein